MRDARAGACDRRWGAVMRRVVAVLLGFLVFIGFLGWGPYQKYRLDREVDRLCAIDGGARIYETVTLSKENFGPNGEVFPQFRSDVKRGGGLGPDYEWKSIREDIRVGNPSLTRWRTTIKRVRDGKLLAEQVNYVRGGGDAPGPAAPSSHGCSTVAIDLTSKVFFKEKAK